METQIGASYWECRRKQWIGNQQLIKDDDPPCLHLERNYLKLDHLSDIQPTNFDEIYKQIVFHGRRFTKPVPLEFVVDVLYHGWKKVRYFII